MSFPTFEELKAKAEQYGVEPARGIFGIAEQGGKLVPSAPTGVTPACCGLGIALLGEEVVLREWNYGTTAFLSRSEVIFQVTSWFIDGYITGFDNSSTPSRFINDTYRDDYDEYMAGYSRGQSDAIAFGL